MCLVTTFNLCVCSLRQSQIFYLFFLSLSLSLLSFVLFSSPSIFLFFSFSLLCVCIDVCTCKMHLLMFVSSGYVELLLTVQLAMGWSNLSPVLYTTQDSHLMMLLQRIELYWTTMKVETKATIILAATKISAPCITVLVP